MSHASPFSWTPLPHIGPAPPLPLEEDEEDEEDEDALLEETLAELWLLPPMPPMPPMPPSPPPGPLSAPELFVSDPTAAQPSEPAATAIPSPNTEAIVWNARRRKSMVILGQSIAQRRRDEKHGKQLALSSGVQANRKTPLIGRGSATQAVLSPDAEGPASAPKGQRQRRRASVSAEGRASGCGRLTSRLHAVKDALPAFGFCSDFGALGHFASELEFKVLGLSIRACHEARELGARFGCEASPFA